MLSYAMQADWDNIFYLFWAWQGLIRGLVLSDECHDKSVSLSRHMVETDSFYDSFNNEYLSLSSVLSVKIREYIGPISRWALSPAPGYRCTDWLHYNREGDITRNVSNCLSQRSCHQSSAATSNV